MFVVSVPYSVFNKTNQANIFKNILCEKKRKDKKAHTYSHINSSVLISSTKIIHVKFGKENNKKVVMYINIYS